MGRKLTAVKEYPGVSIIGESDKYYIDAEDGESVRVPHGRPPEGQFLSETNYYELSQQDTHINDIIDSLGVKVGVPKDNKIWGARPVVEPEDEPEQEPVVQVTPAKVRKKRAKTEEPAPEPPPPAKTYTLVWNIPGVGTIQSDYSKVLVGEDCVVLGIGKGNNNVFVPTSYMESKQAVYNALFDNKTYKVVYTGINYKDGDTKMYVLIGSQE